MENMNFVIAPLSLIHTHTHTPFEQADVSSDEDVKDIIWELKVLQHVGAHPNVVSLLGAAIDHGECVSHITISAASVKAKPPPRMDELSYLGSQGLTLIPQRSTSKQL